MGINDRELTCFYLRPLFIEGAPIGTVINIGNKPGDLGLLVFSPALIILVKVWSQLQWNLDLWKPHYRKNSDYETDLEEISVHLTKKYSRCENENRKFPPTAILPEFGSITWTLCCALILLNSYITDYFVINEHISLSGYNIHTVYDCWNELHHL